MTYKFLVFSLLLLIPGIIVFFYRPDLRKVIYTMSIFAVPFAFTEQLFYPQYWEPVFLFDLVNIIGFGIEDVIFVVGLASFTSTVFAVVFVRRYEALLAISLLEAFKRGVGFLIVVFIGVAILFLAEIEMIYGSVIIMVLGYCFVSVQRRDLALPGIMGAILSLLVYSFFCLIILKIYPTIFELTWHAEHFLNVYILGIPLEEYLYAFSAGLVATVFYPYIFCQRLTKFKHQK